MRDSTEGNKPQRSGFASSQCHGAAGHDAAARREAAVKRFEPVAPEPEALQGARGGKKLSGGRWQRVEGPHLRTLRKACPRNRTGVVGISLGHVMKNGRIQRVLYVNLGRTHRKVYVERIGPTEAWKRAVKIRAEHERRIAAANAAILRARGAGPAASGAAASTSTSHCNHQAQ